jgi:hypothetical protein
MDLLAPHCANFPVGLGQHRRFLPWALHGRRKVPLDRFGERCNANDAASWQTLEAAVQQYRYGGEGPRGIGFALRGSGVVAIDLDGCVNAQTGEIADGAQQVIDLFPSYCEYSPSATGIHLLLAADLPGGSRRIPNGHVLNDGIITLSGHCLRSGPIAPGGKAWRQWLESLPPKPSRQTETMDTAPLGAVLNAALINENCARLWQGHDWSLDGRYATRSESDAGLAMHFARQHADADTITSLLKSSGLPRDPRRTARYFRATADFVLAHVTLPTPRWAGIAVPPQNDSEREVVQILESVCDRATDGVILQRLTREVIAQRDCGADRTDGLVRISIQAISGDYPDRDGVPSAERILSRQGCRKALHRLAQRGLFAIETIEDTIVRPGAGRYCRQTGRVTAVRVSGEAFIEIMTGFVQRLVGSQPETTQPCVSGGNSVPASAPTQDRHADSAPRTPRARCTAPSRAATPRLTGPRRRPGCGRFLGRRRRRFRRAPPRFRSGV